jgi:cellulose synthase/poly-beta-1,6-N-acetylglucosamine synthase-like glycosyltransferase
MVDGDTMLRKDWYVKALPVLKKERKIAGVCGLYQELMPGDSVTVNVLKEAELAHTIGELDTISVGLFRKKALEDIGSYNPHLTSAEDKEMTKRGILKGYKFIRIDVIEGEHYTSGKEDDSYTLIDYLKRYFWYGIGEGQAARFHLKLGEKKFFRMIAQYYFNLNFIRAYMIFLFYMMIAGLNLFAFHMISTTFYPIMITAVIDIVIIVLWILAKQNEFAFKIVLLGGKLVPDFKKSDNFKVLLFNLSIIPYVMFRQSGFIKGFTPKPEKIESYPQNIELVSAGKLIDKAV